MEMDIKSQKVKPKNLLFNSFASKNTIKTSMYQKQNPKIIQKIKINQIRKSKWNSIYFSGMFIERNYHYQASLI
jgi:hypothetical protein